MYRKFELLTYICCHIEQLPVNNEIEKLEGHI